MSRRTLAFFPLALIAILACEGDLIKGGDPPLPDDPEQDPEMTHQQPSNPANTSDAGQGSDSGSKLDAGKRDAAKDVGVPVDAADDVADASGD